MGEPAPERIADEWIWAEFWTRYFTDREPHHTWVVQRDGDGSVSGYLTGTADVARADRYLPWLLPGIAWRVVSRRLLRRSDSRRVIVGMLRSFVGGELDAPARVRVRYPATCHVNLLPDARGYGLGLRLVAIFIEHLRQAGVNGIHVETLGANEAVANLNRAIGFQLVGRRPIGVWRHLDGWPVEVWTWGMEVGGER